MNRIRLVYRIISFILTIILLFSPINSFANDEISAEISSAITNKNYVYLTEDELDELDSYEKSVYKSLCDELLIIKPYSAVFSINSNKELNLSTHFNANSFNSFTLCDTFDSSTKIGSSNNYDNFSDDYFYNQLDSNLSKDIYKTAYKCFVEKQSIELRYSGKLNSNNNNYNDTRTGIFVYSLEAVNAIMDSYPLAFEWFDRLEGFDINYHLNRGNVGALTIRFTEKSEYWSEELEKEAVDKTKQIVLEAKEYASKNYSDDIDAGIVRYFNDWLDDNNYYSNEALDERNMNKSVFYYSHTSYGCLLKGFGVCESYALAMHRLLQEAGIENQYVTGYCDPKDPFTTGHAWNYVKMKDGYYYLVDSTWNDGENNDKNYDYFLVGSNADNGSSYKHIPTGTTFSYNGYFDGKNRFDYVDISTVGYYEKRVVSSNVLRLGKSEQLTDEFGKVIKNKGYKFSSSDNDIISVSNKGKLKAKKEGEVTISVSDGTNTRDYIVSSYSLKSIEFDTVSSNKITEKSQDLNEKTYQLKINISDNFKDKILDIQHRKDLQNDKKFKFLAKSSNKKIAKVTKYAIIDNKIILNVKPKKKGNAKITCYYDNKKATLKLKIK